MNISIDTQIFIWWDDTPAKMSPTALALCSDPANTIYLSLANVVAFHQRVNNLQLLPITSAHIFALETLPFVHRDPFDRLLIAQSNTEPMPLLSADTVFSSYNVNLLT